MIFNIVFAICSIGAVLARPGLLGPIIGAEELLNEMEPRINKHNNLINKNKPDIVKVDDVCSWDGNRGCNVLCVEWGYLEGECDDFNDCICYSRNSLLNNDTSAESSEEQDRVTTGTSVTTNGSSVITTGSSVTTTGPSVTTSGPTIYPSTTTTTTKRPAVQPPKILPGLTTSNKPSRTNTN